MADQPLGLPKGSVRSLLALLIVAGFIALNFLIVIAVIGGKLTVEQGVAVIAPLGAVATAVAIFYFESRARQENGQ